MSTYDLKLIVKTFFDAHRVSVPEIVPCNDVAEGGVFFKVTLNQKETFVWVDSEGVTLGGKGRLANGLRSLGQLALQIACEAVGPVQARSFV